MTEVAVVAIVAARLGVAVQVNLYSGRVVIRDEEDWATLGYIADPESMIELVDELSKFWGTPKLGESTKAGLRAYGLTTQADLEIEADWYFKTR